MRVEQGQLWRHADPHVIGRSWTYKVLSFKEGWIIVRDEWSGRKEEMRPEYLIEYMELIDPVLRARFDKRRLHENNTSELIFKNGNSTWRKIKLRKTPGRMRSSQ